MLRLNGSSGCLRIVRSLLLVWGSTLIRRRVRSRDGGVERSWVVSCGVVASLCLLLCTAVTDR